MGQYLKTSYIYDLIKDVDQVEAFWETVLPYATHQIYVIFHGLFLFSLLLSK